MEADEIYEINPDKLIEEAIRQPKLMKHAARLLAEAKKVVSTLKGRLKLKAAKLTKAIYADPAAYGITGRSNKDLVEASVLTDESFIALQKELIKAEYARDILEGNQTALVDKRKGIENGINLWMADYFASCRMPKGPIDMQGMYGQFEPGKGIKKK